MPIAQKYSINGAVTYLVWAITETEQELLSHLNLNEEELADFNTVKTPSRRLEWLGARTALKFLVKDLGQFYIYKDEFGKPHLKDTAIGISVSHTKGYGAAAINLNGRVGIDIEHPRQQILKIAHKFLHTSEKSWAENRIDRLTKIWSAKEALYKLHGRTQLTFSTQLVIDDSIGYILEHDGKEEHNLVYSDKSEFVLSIAY